MNYEVELVTIVDQTQLPGPTPPQPQNVALTIEGFIAGATPPLPLPTGPIKARRDQYAWLLRAAFAARRAAIPRDYSLARDAQPCRVNPDGSWDPLDGVSIELLWQVPEEGVPVPRRTTHYLSIGPKVDGVPDSNTCSWPIVNETDGPVVGVTLFLAHTRSRLVSGACVVAGEISKLQVASGGSHSVLHASLVTPLASTSAVEVQFTYLGDPPHVRALTWWTNGGRAVRSPGGGNSLPLTVPASQTGRLLGYARTEQEEFDLRAAHIAGIHDSTRLHREFFFDLDYATQPPGGPDFAPLTAYLRRRYLVRGEVTGFGDTYAAAPVELESWRADAEQAAGKLKEVLREYYAKCGKLAVDRVEEAFELFASGQLTDFDTHGAPNGANYFAFCEFALLCVELGHERDFWKSLVPIFARTAEIFARCYHQVDGPRMTCAYRVAHNPNGARTFSQAERTALRGTWAGRDPVLGFGQVVHAALYDELGQVTVPPYPLPDK